MELDLDCRRCRLCEKRTHIVPPTGELRSKVVFVGEAPGEKEDLAAVPFVGRAGKMLDRILWEGGLPRGKIFITNTVKCRPPGNRRPQPDEVEACFAYLEQELEDRELIVTLGKTAGEALLRMPLRLRDCVNRSTSVELEGKSIEVLPSYHPSACLYNLEAREGLKRTVRIVRERFPEL